MHVKRRNPEYANRARRGRGRGRDARSRRAKRTNGSATNRAQIKANERARKESERSVVMRDFSCSVGIFLTTLPGDSETAVVAVLSPAPVLGAAPISGAFGRQLGLNQMRRALASPVYSANSNLIS